MAIVPLRAPIVETQPRPTPWSLEAIAGRLVEVAGADDSAALTLASGIIHDAQRVGEQAAWIAPADALCFAPDLIESGLDLDALVIVRARDAAAGARAADKLLRSGAFGVVVVDAGPQSRIPTPLLARLASLAQRHHTALVFLTHHVGAAASTDGASSRPDRRLSPPPESSSAGRLGSLVSLRVRARRQRIAADRFRCWIEVLKDKRRGPTWGYEEVCRGAPGMR